MFSVSLLCAPSSWRLFDVLFFTENLASSGLVVVFWFSSPVDVCPAAVSVFGGSVTSSRCALLISFLGLLFGPGV